MSAFHPEQALARYIELWKIRGREFLALPDLNERAAEGDYDFFPRVDIELDELRQEAQRNGLVLEGTWDEAKQHIVSLIERMTPEPYATYLRDEQEE